MKIRYTRYDIKRKKKNKAISFIITFIFMISLVFAGGVILKNIKDKTSTTEKENKIGINDDKKDKEVVFTKGEIVKYAAVQGGMFKNEEYAKENKNKLVPFGSPFVVTEGEFKRVILGVYGEEESKKIIEELAKEKIESSRLILQITYNEASDFQRAQIVNAYLQILSKLGEKNVKSIQTKELKAWAASLNGIDKSGKNIEKLNEIKNKVQSLPEQIYKENLEENYIFLYNYLNKVD